ncbi:MAG: hypothetical protein IPF93_08355 [Saprospiraceae bacterium]|nr:hypothetical protein [Saprospiraceae bacterium]
MITGTNSKVGTARASTAVEHYGEDKVLCTDIRKPKVEHGPFEMLDILNVQRMAEIIEDHLISPRSITWLQYSVPMVGGILKDLECESQWPTQHPPNWLINTRWVKFFSSTIAVFAENNPSTKYPSTYRRRTCDRTTGMSKLDGNYGVSIIINVMQ